jgi:hypothetical protein
MNAITRHAAFLLALGLGVAVLAVERLNVTWTEDVGSTVRFLDVEVGAPGDGQRIVSLTYQALRPCKHLSLFGHSMSKDGTKLAKFALTSGRSNAGVDQKFRDTVVVAYQEGHHLVVDEVSCL